MQTARPLPSDENEVVELLIKPGRRRKNGVDVLSEDSGILEGQKIDDAWWELRLATPLQLSQKTDIDLDRVMKHVVHRIKKGKNEPQARLVKDAPRRRVPPECNFIGEVPEKEPYVEGSVSKVLVNRFERDQKARAACLRVLGYTCQVCSMSFLERYGEIGERFIHVHHREPLAIRKAEYHPKPTEDLVPVCPNCHAMLHTSDPPLEVDELQRIMKKLRDQSR